MKARSITAAFLLLLFGLAIVNLLTADRAFSENENRYLQQLPEFTVERLFQGKYTSEFDQYVIDQFTFRDGWVGAKSVAELTLQKRTSNGVYFTKENSLIEMFDTVDMDRYQKNLGFIASFADKVEAGTDATVRTILIPSASMVQADKLPAFAPEVSQPALLDIAASELDGFVNLSGSLLRHAQEYIYYRTDHHWTSLGAYYGYNSLREQMGQSQRPIDEYRLEVLSEDFYGTTWSKASLYTIPPDTITAYVPRELGAIHVDYNDGEQTSDSIYERSFLNVKDKYSVFLNANQSVTRIDTGVKNGKKLLLIKDSYANTFVQFLMTDYEEILVIDPRYYRSSFYDVVADNGITDVLVLYSLKGFSSDANIYFIST